jgi:hypothetical protein
MAVIKVMMAISGDRVRGLHTSAVIMLKSKGYGVGE